MDAALDLATPAPTAGPLVLAGLDWACARQAADRRKALGDQRVPRQSGLSDIFEHVACAPTHERIHFDPFAFRFEQRQSRARRALETLPAGDPGVKFLHRLGERPDLANVAAAVRIAGEEELLRVFLRDRLRLRLGDDDVREL